MKDATPAELFVLYYEVLENAERFVAFDFDMELTEFVFTELDTGLHSFYHQNTLTKLLDTHYITKDIEELSTQLRDHYFSMIDAGKWDVEQFTNRGTAWVDLFARIKEIKDKLALFNKSI